MIAVSAHVLYPDALDADNNEVFPQVLDFGPGYEWDAPDAAPKLPPHAPPPEPPNLRTVTLNPDTEFTDVLTQTYITAPGLLVSERLISAIRSAVLQSHEIYPATVSLRAETRPYLWLHLTTDVAESLDFQASEFFIEKCDGSPADAPAIHDVCGLRASSRDLINTGRGDLRARRLVFRPGTPRYDLFCVVLTAPRWIASEQLTPRLASLTGFELVPAPFEVWFS